MRTDDDYVIDLGRLLWVGPATVVAAVAAVQILQALAIPLLNPGPRSLLRSDEPAIFTTVLVTIAIIVFGVVRQTDPKPLRTYRDIAFAALLVSCVPDLAIGFGLIRPRGWRLATVFVMMHIAAWAVTVEMLSRLATRKRES